MRFLGGLITRGLYLLIVLALLDWIGVVDISRFRDNRQAKLPPDELMLATCARVARAHAEGRTVDDLSEYLARQGRAAGVCGTIEPPEVCTYSTTTDGAPTSVMAYAVGSGDKAKIRAEWQTIFEDKPRLTQHLLITSNVAYVMAKLREPGL